MLLFYCFQPGEAFPVTYVIHFTERLPAQPANMSTTKDPLELNHTAGTDPFP